MKITLVLLAALLIPSAARAQQGALAAAPGQAGSFVDKITLKVPVELKDMTAERARVTCAIYGDDLNKTLGSGFWETRLLATLDGQFEGVVEVVATPSEGSHFVGAKSYKCFLQVLPHTIHLWIPPKQGTPQSGLTPDQYARPNTFFRAEVSGLLSGVAVSGPGALQQ